MCSMKSKGDFMNTYKKNNVNITISKNMEVKTFNELYDFLQIYSK